MINLKLSAIFLMMGMLIVPAANANNNVVVIPMGGDNVSIAQQHFSYRDSKNTASGNFAYMCYSDVYDTPDQTTQVLLIANANGRFSANCSFWNVKIQVRKDLGSWSNISDIRSYSAAFSGAYSQISTTDILDLDSNSSYQFRVQLNPQVGATFTGTYTEYCELVVSASYKLPSGKSILGVSP